MGQSAEITYNNLTWDQIGLPLKTMPRYHESQWPDLDNFYAQKWAQAVTDSDKAEQLRLLQIRYEFVETMKLDYEDKIP